MFETYRYTLDCSVVEHLTILPIRQREEFVSTFRFLAKNPFQIGESTFLDSTGRHVQKKIFGRWLVSFWADHAVKEVKIVGVQKVTN